jgi:hypothetical protein
MANFRISNATRNALADQLDATVNGGSAVGTIKIYSGTQPATADTALSGNTLLATFTLSNPAFGNSGATNPGQIDLSGTPLTTTGAAAGTATFARCATGGTGGAGTVFDCDVSGTGGGGTLQLNTTTISVGVNLSITSGSVTMPTG